MSKGGSRRTKPAAIFGGICSPLFHWNFARNIGSIPPSARQDTLIFYCKETVQNRSSALPSLLKPLPQTHVRSCRWSLHWGWVACPSWGLRSETPHLPAVESIAQVCMRTGRSELGWGSCKCLYVVHRCRSTDLTAVRKDGIITDLHKIMVI